jgi:cobalt-zinc-cadmium efflux system membrane fusion protein
MITFTRSNRRFALSATALFITLGLGANLSAQSHDGHDHGEETTSSESHTEHAGHDEHANEKPQAKHAEHEEAGGHEGHDESEEEIVKLSPEVLREFSIEVGAVGSGKLHEEIVLPGEVQFNREQLAYVTPRYAGTVQSIGARLADSVKKGQVLATLESTETLRPFEVKAPFDGVITGYEITPGQTVDAGVPLFTVADLSSVWADLRIYQGSLNRVTKGQSVQRMEFA